MVDLYCDTPACEWRGMLTPTRIAGDKCGLCMMPACEEIASEPEIESPTNIAGAVRRDQEAEGQVDMADAADAEFGSADTGDLYEDDDDLAGDVEDDEYEDE